MEMGTVHSEVQQEREYLDILPRPKYAEIAHITPPVFAFTSLHSILPVQSHVTGTRETSDLLVRHCLFEECNGFSISKS